MTIKEQSFLDPVEHNSEDELELYVYSRLAPPAVDRLEGHLLICESCRTALDEAVVYHRAMREGAAAQVRVESVAEPGGWFGWLRTPSFALVAVTVVLLAAAGWFATRPAAPRAPLAVIELVAVRGNLPVTGRAQQTELRLKDAGDISGEVEVVDAKGGLVWKGSVTPGGILRVNRALAEGAYFVRLYDGPRLIHEYGFRVIPN